MRARRFARRVGKRSTSWIAGFSCFDDVPGTDSRNLSLVGPIAGTVNTYGAAVTLMDAVDLPMHGGEDAVFTRARGHLIFFAGRKDAGAGLAAFTFVLRLTVAQHEVAPAADFRQAFTRSADMGDDRILWQKDVFVTADTYTGLGGFDWDQPWRINIDVRAKRRVQVDNAVVLYMQTVLPIGTVVGTGADFRIAGGLRVLAMRPR